MSYLNEIIHKFYKEEKYVIIFIIIINLLINLFKINILSFIIANIIQSINKKEINITYKFYYFFIIVSIIYLILYYIFKFYQSKILTKLRQWIKVELINKTLLINNDNFSNFNFTKLNTPIIRISSHIFYIFNNIISVIIPNLSVLCIILIYFFYKNVNIAIIFLIGNILILFYFYFNIKNIIKLNDDYENDITDSESYLVEILNNIDKIIYRGNKDEEMEIFKNKSDKVSKKGLLFYLASNYNSLIITIIVYITIFITIFYMIKLYYNKKIESTIFITFITILLLYRDIISIGVGHVPEIIEFSGRFNGVFKIFDKMNEENNYNLKKNNNKNINNNLMFNNIKFKNVSFKYNNDSKILDNFNLDINTDKIIGLTGLSGHGKSTIAKLLLNMYNYKGNIYIDDIDINDLDSNYIRKNIIYINQNSKLFDKKIIENILYGCNKDDYNTCYKHLNKILESDKIKKLYKNINFDKKVGFSGENMSGGQRQIINIINGLIVPSKIVIIDEPTNGLDIELKKEVIEIIKYFKNFKKSIIIISHDKDIYNIFDQTINIK